MRPIMNKLPPDRLRLPEAVEKYKQYGFTYHALIMAIQRKRLAGFRSGSTWYTTDRDMKKYIKNRMVEKIPRAYKKKA